MNKREFAVYIRERIMEVWETEVLAETAKSSFIYLYKLIDNYSEEEIIEAARWLRTWTTPRNVASLWTSIGRWKWEKDKNERRKLWQFT